MERNPLYLMISRTDTGIGKVIRLFTRYEFNHVSMTLDSDFQRWVSFARYVQGVPLAGGFVEESAERFLAMEGPVNVRIYRLDMTPERYAQLESLFAQAGNPDNGLIYNSFGFLASAFGKRLHIPGAYTCLEFAGTVLERDFGAIRALDRALSPHLIYEGDLKALLDGEPAWNHPYFTRRGLAGGTLDTIGHFRKLLIRAVHPGSYRDPVISNH